MTALASHLGIEERRGFRRLLVVSALVHLGVFSLFSIAPMPSGQPAGLPNVVPVDLVELGALSPAPARPPAPAPKSEPEAAPRPPPPKPPPPPVQKKVVLPAEPAPPQPKPEPKPEAKPRPEPPPPEPRRRELDPSEVEPAPQAQDYEDVLAQLRAEAGEPESPPQPAPSAPAGAPAQAAAVPGVGGSSGRPVSPEVAAWVTRVKIHVRRNWVVPPGFRTQPLQTHLSVRLAADGSVLGEPEILRRSGNPWFDEGVVRAIQKASPLPAPPEAGEWPFVFDPRDSY